ncbi:hypothetical protein D9M68_892320 [compost metagenome]
MHDLVAHPARGDLARPAHDARHAQAAFHGRVIGAAPGAGRAAVRSAELGAVVAREDEEGVFRNAEALDLVDDLAHAVVHLHHGVGEIAMAGAAREIAVRQGGKVQMRER